MIKYVYGGVNTCHGKGEFCGRKVFPHYSFFYFRTPFSYLSNDGLINAGRGEIVIVPPFSPVYHGPQRDMEEGFRNDWFYAKGEEIKRLLDKFGLPINRAFPISSPELVKNCIVAIEEEITNKAEGYEDKVDLLIRNMMIDIFRASRDSKSADSRLAEARAFMSKNLSQSHTISDLAALSGYSVSRFCELYVKKYGASPKADLLKMRLENAKRLLVYTTLTIDMISSECGFGSIYHFSKFFKAHVGVSPSLFRTSNCENK